MKSTRFNNLEHAGRQLSMRLAALHLQSPH